MLVAPLAAGGWAAGCSRGTSEQAAEQAALKPAPAFSYTLLDGSVAHTAALRGRVLLVNFWATTCAVCVKEMPQLVATHARFQPQGLHMLAVAVRHDPPALVADYAQSRRLPFDVVIDNTGAIADGFADVRGTPTTFVLSRAGLIAQRIEGEPDFPRLHALIQRLLAQA